MSRRNPKTIKQLADEMDRACENANAHSFAGTHRALAVLLIIELGSDTARNVLQAIRREGGPEGIPGLTRADGTGPDGPSFLERKGISEYAEDWQPSVQV